VARVGFLSELKKFIRIKSDLTRGITFLHLLGFWLMARFIVHAVFLDCCQRGKGEGGIVSIISKQRRLPILSRCDFGLQEVQAFTILYYKKLNYMFPCSHRTTFPIASLHHAANHVLSVWKRGKARQARMMSIKS
jgi:hypothetical protein